jgi:phosphatidylinositol alpha-1,6-mannosyltransferase
LRPPDTYAHFRAIRKVEVVDAILATSSFLPGHGGIESYLSELCARLAPRLAVVAPATRDGEPIPQDLPYPTHGYDALRHVSRAVIDAARRHETNRVLFGAPWPLALLGPQLKGAGLRYSVIVHGAELLVPSAIPLMRSRFRRALSQADLLLAVSEFTAGKLRGLGPPVEVLRARVDTNRFSSDVATDELRDRLGIGNRKVVLCLGRIVRRKGVDRLVEAARRLAADGREVVAVIGGTGPDLDRVRRGAEKTRAPAIFLGRVAEADAPALYALADAFALPVVDRWFGLEVEGLGVVLLEAAACCTPCVAGRSGGTAEAVLDEKTGFVIDGSDVAVLTDRLARLLDDPEEARAMGEAGRAHVEANFAGDLPPGLLEWLAT